MTEASLLRKDKAEVTVSLAQMLKHPFFFAFRRITATKWSEEPKLVVAQRLPAISVSASGRRPANPNPLTGRRIHNLMIWADDSLISRPLRLISAIAICMWCS